MSLQLGGLVAYGDVFEELSKAAIGNFSAPASSHLRNVALLIKEERRRARRMLAKIDPVEENGRDPAEGQFSFADWHAATMLQAGWKAARLRKLQVCMKSAFIQEHITHPEMQCYLQVVFDQVGVPEPSDAKRPLGKHGTEADIKWWRSFAKKVPRVV